MDLFMMGKYSAYIWTSFGITLAVVVICVMQARHRHRSVLKDIETRIRAMEGEQ